MKAGIRVGVCTCAVLVASYRPPEVIATFNVSALSESSGLAASRRHPGILWSHNDSGHAPVLFALTLTGKFVGGWTLKGARMIDWEALAIGPGPTNAADYLYVGDIGDNLSRREQVVVYRIREPDVRSKQRTAAATALQFRYPDGPHDAEGMAVHPLTGDLYIVTKARGLDLQTGVYKASAPLQPGKTRALERVATLDLEYSLFSLFAGLVTGATIAPDGSRVALCSYANAWEATLPPGGVARFDEIWKGPWSVVDAGDRPRGEAIAYSADGDALLLSSEGVPFDLVRIARMNTNRQ